MLLFLAAALLVTAFCYIESRVASCPVIPLRFLRSVAILRVLLASVPMLFAWNQVCSSRDTMCAFVQMTFLNVQIIFDLALYAEVRANDGSTFKDWALTCLFFGQPLGAFIAGYIIKYTGKIKSLLFVNALLSLALYALLAFGWIGTSTCQ